jgi:hypothetical protein
MKKSNKSFILTFIYLICGMINAELFTVCGYNMFTWQWWIGMVCIWISYGVGYLNGE